MTEPAARAGRSAVVLGGTAGVGRAVVDALLAEGYRVGVVARGEERLATMARELPGRVAIAAADVADDAALRAAVDHLVAEVGVPDIWVNCAMITSFSSFRDMAPDEFRRITEVTYLGQVNGTRAALSVMRRGAIVCVGSGLAYRSVPFQSAYCGAKSAINGFAQALRSELIREGRPITLSLVQLPAVNTPQFDWARNRMDRRPQPAPPIFAPEVAARAVVRAARTGARELLVGVPVLKLVFGNFVLPAFIDRMFARQGAEMQQSDRPEPGDRPDNLMGPIPHPAVAQGSFGDRARASAFVIDGDLARKLVLLGGPGLVFLAGLGLGLALG